MMLSQQQININWPEVYMMAEANREPFTDIRIVTAKSEFVSVNGDLSYTHHPTTNGISNYNNAVIASMAGDAIAVHEQVTISADGEITVVVNRDHVDDDATWVALDLLTRALDELDGESGTVRFGAPLIFSPSDILWLVLH